METCLAHWNDREMQLVRLHEEILSKREALLNCSISYHQSQELRSKQLTVTSEEAYIRKHTLLQDIRKSQTEVFESLNSAPSPRFMTLQKNYWAMVRSQVPMWEQDLGIVPAPTSTRSAPTPRGGHSRRRKAASQQSSLPSRRKPSPRHAQKS
ncbi:uncharacterized protein C3orf14-like [Dreissena polymorpha]|uniref:Uncharacterized protein n=1 Tax=Dreissena polymorpha TaxID=45954 RepID=A0A9D4H8P9_DREPO|nr:uncharacterized protein C3orf14-like [Dreissena polymorpha]KAH3827312.1 hypothetical protein DPMN_129244 [Dreissena polymorpha]